MQAQGQEDGRHVARCLRALTQVKELIRLVEPEVVGVELCKDRLPLLINTDSDTAPNIWHCRRVSSCCQMLPPKAHEPACFSCCSAEAHVHPLIKAAQSRREALLAQH